MLHIRSVEELGELLLLLNDLVRQQELGSPDFPANVDRWLVSLERALEANRLHQAGGVAMLRSAMLAAKQGQAPSVIELRGRQTRSRLLKAVASDAMRHGAEIASAVIAENQPRIEEATGIAHQIAAAALSRGLVPSRDGRVGNSQYLRDLRRGFASTADLESAVVHLEGLVGPHDALILLDRALTSHIDAREQSSGE